jgi:hypothetical protein
MPPVLAEAVLCPARIELVVVDGGLTAVHRRILAPGTNGVAICEDRTVGHRSARVQTGEGMGPMNRACAVIAGVR